MINGVGKQRRRDQARGWDRDINRRSPAAPLPVDTLNPPGSGARAAADLAALRQRRRRRQRDRKSGEEGFKGRERPQVDGRKRRGGKRLEMLMHVVSSASGARHRCKESSR